MAYALKDNKGRPIKLKGRPAHGASEALICQKISLNNLSFFKKSIYLIKIAQKYLLTY